MTPLRERLWSKIRGPWVEGVEVDDCWLYVGRWRSEFGYGRIREAGRDSRSLLAHREAYRIVHGSISAQLVVRHRCDNPLCCNPLHLLKGTPAQNLRDQWRRRRRTNRSRLRDRPDLYRQPTAEDYE